MRFSMSLDSFSLDLCNLPGLFPTSGHGYLSHHHSISYTTQTKTLVMVIAPLSGSDRKRRQALRRLSLFVTGHDLEKKGARRAEGRLQHFLGWTGCGDGGNCASEGLFFLFLLFFCERERSREMDMDGEREFYTRDLFCMVFFFCLASCVWFCVYPMYVCVTKCLVLYG